MMQQAEQELADFCVVGVNHWEATIDVREKFSLSDQEQRNLIEGAIREGITSLFAITTCNRTELIAKDTAPEELIRLLITYSEGTLDEFHKFGFEKKGRQAVEHLFQVTVGLDSQILGDLQIVN
ncbi:MAG: hypothetical protein R3281_06195, partial [Balneolaceae bacterium]|nr:hypothetical protein [Balneolaceae bacterium]